MSPIIALFSAALSAFLLSAGIPNEILKSGSSLLGLVSLVPLYIALKKTKSWHMAGLLGGLTMMLVHLGSSFWLANFKEFAIFTLGGSALVNLVFGVLVGYLLFWALSRPEQVRPFLFAAVWAVWEWFKSIGFLAYPWGTIIMSSRELHRLIQIADLTGTWGISFLMALVSAMLAEAVMKVGSARRYFPLDRSVIRMPFFRSALFTAFLLVLAVGYGTFRLATLGGAVSSLDVVMVQQNADSWDDNGARAAILSSEELTFNAILDAGKKPDLVVWSESVLTWPWNENRDAYAKVPKEYPVTRFLSDLDAPLLVGSPVLVDPANDGYSNSVILLAPDGSRTDYHAKVQLVPFAEYMPLTEYAIVRKVFDSLVGFSRGWIPGTSVDPMTVVNKTGRDIHISTPICFEDAFSSLNARMHNAGSDIIINLTNDSWSKTDSAEMQHFAIASFRSIELRKTMVRSTNGGYSVVLSPAGEIIADMPLFQKSAILTTVPVYPHITTPYARFGDWFPALLAVLVALNIIAAVRLDRKDSNR